MWKSRVVKARRSLQPFSSPTIFRDDVIIHKKKEKKKKRKIVSAPLASQKVAEVGGKRREGRRNCREKKALMETKG